MEDRTLIFVVLLIALVFLWKRSASRAIAPDQLTTTASNPPAPAFGFDAAVHVPPDPALPDPAILRAQDIAEATAKVEATNPAILAAKADPAVAASNAYYGQFIGKIT